MLYFTHLRYHFVVVPLEPPDTILPNSSHELCPTIIYSVKHAFIDFPLLCDDIGWGQCSQIFNTFQNVKRWSSAYEMTESHLMTKVFPSALVSGNIVLTHIQAYPLLLVYTPYSRTQGENRVPRPMVLALSCLWTEAFSFRLHNSSITWPFIPWLSTTTNCFALGIFPYSYQTKQEMIVIRHPTCIYHTWVDVDSFIFRQQ